MTHLFTLLAVVTALVFAFFVGAGLWGYVVFIGAALLAAWLATQMPSGSERIYWGFVGLTIALLTISNFGLNLDKLVIITPLVFTLCYFVARLALKFTGEKPSS